MKKLLATTFAVMILAGALGTFVPNDQDHWGTDLYWERITQDG